MISLLYAIRCSTDKLDELFVNLTETIANRDAVEILIKIDRDDEVLLSYYDKKLYEKHGLKINFIITDRGEGYFSLGHAYNQLMLAANIRNRFLWIGNSSIRFHEKNWDKKLLSLPAPWTDGIFYVRTSPNKKHEYDNEDTEGSLIRPDNFAFYTRRLIQLMEGIGDYWSADSWFGGILATLEVKYKIYRRIVWPGDLYEPQSLIYHSSPEKDKKVGTTLKKLASGEYVKYTYDRIAHNIAGIVKNSPNLELKTNENLRRRAEIRKARNNKAITITKKPISTTSSRRVIKGSKRSKFL